MSMFLPEGFGQQQPANGVASITPSSPETTQEDIALMQRVLSAASRNPNLIPSDFMAYVLDFIQTQRLQIPIGQVFGFSQFTAQAVDLAGITDTSASTAYVNATHAGPELPALGDGQYVFIWRVNMSTSTAGILAYANLSVNGVTPPNDDDAAVSGAQNLVSATGFSIQTLDNGGSSDVKLVYRVDGATTGKFGNRSLVAFKFANL